MRQILAAVLLTALLPGHAGAEGFQPVQARDDNRLRFTVDRGAGRSATFSIR